MAGEPWLKKAVLPSFRLNDMGPIAGAAGGANWWTRCVEIRGLGRDRFRAAGFRAVPGSVVRRSAYIAPNVAPRRPFVNLGAASRLGHDGPHLGDGAPGQIGKNVHIAVRRRHRRRARAAEGGPGDHRGQLLRRQRASEDRRGRHLREGSVLSMGVFTAASQCQ